MHTKGPLIAEYSNVYRVTESEDGDIDTWIMIADCLSGIHLSYEEAKANAVLFATAPDLLEVLETLSVVADTPYPIDKKWHSHFVAEAVRKAKGE